MHWILQDQEVVGVTRSAFLVLEFTPPRRHECSLLAFWPYFPNFWAYEYRQDPDNSLRRTEPTEEMYNVVGVTWSDLHTARLSTR